MNRIKWTLEELQKAANLYLTRVSFKKNSPKEYNAASKRYLLDEICSHMAEPTNTPYTFKELQEEALKYKTRGEFNKIGRKAYDVAYKRGILDTVCSHMPKHVDQSGENHHRFKWTFEKLQEEALKYVYRIDFQKNSRGAYMAAHKRGILDQICAHLHFLDRSGKNHHGFKWTLEMLKAEALKYDRRISFQKYSPSPYQIAQQKGLLDEICRHMKRSSNSSLAEEELMFELKNFFPNLIKKNFSVEVPGKPYIHRFQVDIFDPISKLGVEFDGKYHHSEQYLIKSKLKIGWPTEDAKNYHQIKDEALWDSHRIKILHITELEWLNNKSDSLNKCVLFLKEKNNV